MNNAISILVSAAFLAPSMALPHAKKHCTKANGCQRPAEHPLMKKTMAIKIEEHAKCVLEKRCPTFRPSSAKNQAPVECVDGMAGEYPCENVDMLAFVNLEDLGCESAGCGGNDVWGWTDPTNGHEIAIMGRSDGVTFIDVTEPTAPVVLGTLDTYTVPSLWRDIKVFRDHAFIGSEASGHGMQIFDLTTLRQYYGNDARGKNIRHLAAEDHYDEFGNSHNIAINEGTGYAYAIGSSTCSGGPHMVDINEPNNPRFVGCFDEDGYTHDAECVIYHGPDQAYAGRELCFLYNENTLTIADVTDKENPIMVARETYEDVYYTHQGWLTEDHSHLFLDDEIDELNGPSQNTCTLVWDITSIAAPVLESRFYSTETVSDHNQYVLENHVFQANYMAGLRVLRDDQHGIEGPVTLVQVGYFDVDPENERPGFEGSWSNYPYFPSGHVALTSMERGFFLLNVTKALEVESTSFNGTKS